MMSAVTYACANSCFTTVQKIYYRLSAKDILYEWQLLLFKELSHINSIIELKNQSYFIKKFHGVLDQTPAVVLSKITTMYMKFTAVKCSVNV